MCLLGPGPRRGADGKFAAPCKDTTHVHYYYKCLKCHGCVAEAVSALPGALVRWLVDCSMCVLGTMCIFLACWWCRVCSSSQHPQQTQHAKCVGGKATTHAPAHRGAQLYSQFSSNNHRGDSRGVASVVSLATTRVQHAAAAATAAAAGHTARGEYVCGCCQRLVSGEERARWLCQLFSVACDASPHLSPCMNPRTDFCS